MPRMRTPRVPALPLRRHPRPDPEWERLADEKDILQRDNMRLQAENAELREMLMETGVREGQRCLSQQ